MNMWQFLQWVIQNGGLGTFLAVVLIAITIETVVVSAARAVRRK